MTAVHKTIMDVRSMFDGLDESVLPGLIDGEKRNVAKYDAALSRRRRLPATVTEPVDAAARQPRAENRLHGDGESGERARIVTKTGNEAGVQRRSPSSGSMP